MPGCASGQFCEDDELPLQGTNVHKCHVCSKVVHNHCVAHSDASDSTRPDPLRYCHVCWNTKMPPAASAVTTAPSEGRLDTMASVATSSPALATPQRGREEEAGDEDGDAGAAVGGDSPFRNQPLASPKKIRRTNLYTGATCFKYKGKDRFSETEMEAACDEIAQKECNLTKMNDHRLIRKSVRESRLAGRVESWKSRQIRYCAYNTDAGCDWQVACHKVFKLSNGSTVLDHCYIHVPKEQEHKDHKGMGRKRGVPRHFTQYAVSPSQMPNEVCTKAVQDEVGGNLDQDKIKRYVGRQKKKYNNREGPQGEERNSWEGFDQYVQQMSIENAAENLKDQHKAYVVGQAIIEPRDKRVVVVVSTHNLLLNAYRQTLYGQDFAFNVDASYRYTTEQYYGLLPVTVVTPTQETRLVAYAVISKEDTSAHAVAFQNIKKQVEDILKFYCENNRQNV